MITGTYLHHHPEFKQLIQIVSDKLTIEPVLIEKDYWIMHCLYGLKQLGLQFELKGGTSLSKGYGIINRFSEDIDIRIDPVSAPFPVYTGKNHSKEKQIQSRREFYDWLAKDKLKIDGIVEVRRDTEFDDEKYRSGGIRLIYESHFSFLAGVKEGILLETGFDKTIPFLLTDISSWAYEYAISSNNEIDYNVAIDIRCYAPEYTLVEKLQTISTKFRQQQKHGTNPTGFMRHYYDVAQLLDLPRVINFIKTDEYQSYKEERFRSEDNRNISENEAFILSDPKIYQLYKQAFSLTTNLYYKEQPSFKIIMDKIKEQVEYL